MCPTRKAYAELCRIITNARRRASKGEYRLALWDLKTVSQCFVIWLPKGDAASDNRWAEWLHKNYQHRLWIGCQRHLTANEQRYLAHCQKLSQQYQIPITACGGILMHNANRLPLQHVLTAIKQSTSVTKLGRQLLSNSERSLRSLPKLNALFEERWLYESQVIAQQCSFDMSELRYEYPEELVPAHKTPSQHLRDLVLKGMSIRLSKEIPNYFSIKRTIAKELKLIRELKYEYFFLTVHDVVQFAKRSHILYQGRGSAANSIVCYCLEITAVDPTKIDVLFERFISKERNEPPDIDVDFEHQRREEVIQYIYEKYGRERTALAATVITYRQKSAIREVGKALGVNETQLDVFIKNTNRRDREISWQAQMSELGFATQSAESQRFINLVDEIKGFPRHLSQHVGGFVISAGPLYQLVPIENAAMPDRSVIQWDKDDLESLGLLKVDVLALGMLTAIRKSFELIRHYEKRALSIAQITQMGDDPQVYKQIQKADTIGVFQIESRAQMSMLPRLKPQKYYDLVIQIAIVRPGPIQGDMVHPFLRRRNGLEEVNYPSVEVQSVLERTMGVPIFQEQVIKVAMVAAGFTGGEADKLRRAMATWKKTGELAKFRDKLIQGMLKRGYEKEFAERIYHQICGFGEYGFPESHSASFAVLAYVSSWLKYYYPAAFYIGLLNSWPMGFYPPAQLIQDARRHAVDVLPICINHSDYDHTMESYKSSYAIRLGLRLVKSFNEESANKIMTRRPSNGYQTIQQLRALNLPPAHLEALASANALQTLKNNRYEARWSLMDKEPDLPLFHHQEPKVDFIPHKPSELSDLIEDYAATSLTLNKHPIQLLKEAGLLKKYVPANQITQKGHKTPVSVVGVVIGRQAPGTAAGVTFMTLEDDTGNNNVIVWLATARAQKQAFLKSKIVRVNGILERGDGGVTHIIAGKITDISHLLDKLNTSSRDFH